MFQTMEESSFRHGKTTTIFEPNKKKQRIKADHLAICMLKSIQNKT
jgi:hypothetical protein